MKGAIIGDIVGSIYEFHNIKTKDFPLFQDHCMFTDDTVMTCAVAKALLEANETGIPRGNADSALYRWADKTLVPIMQDFGRRYTHRGYGGMFEDWIYSDDPKPYNSYGNGSAMRVSPVAWASNGFMYERKGLLSQGDVRYSILGKIATATAKVTHNHPAGIAGAVATAACIVAARRAKLLCVSKNSKWDRSLNCFTNMNSRGFIDSIHRGDYKELVQKQCCQFFPYDFTLDEIRADYKFDVTVWGTIPYAVQAFMESANFEDAIRNAISIGGDSDTIAAITGSIAEAYYGVPERLWDKACSFLTPELIEIVDGFYMTSKWYLLTMERPPQHHYPSLETE